MPKHQLDQPSLPMQPALLGGIDEGVELTNMTSPSVSASTTPSIVATNAENKLLLEEQHARRWPADRQQKSQLEGWKFGVTFHAALATLILITNIVLTIVASKNYVVERGIGTAMVGSCDKVKNWNTIVHVPLNVLSTILLGASSYTMQCLCSPTRKDIDRAHAKGDWLDIGVLSMRNLYKLRGAKVVLSLTLALTSLPIHLVFNSAVFTADSTTNYSVALVNQGFLESGDFTITQALQDRAAVIESKPNNPGTSFEQQLKAMQRTFTRVATGGSQGQSEILTNRECIDAYGNGYTSGRSLLLLLTNATNPDDIQDTVFWWDYAGGTANDHGWICNDVGGTPCNVAATAENAARWTVNGMEIDHCISKLEQEHCKLQFSVSIMYAVIVMNMLKVAVMVTALCWRSDPLVTVGDGLASFLDAPDATTAGRCLMDYREAQDKGPLGFKGITPCQSPDPKKHVAGGKQRWYRALRKRYWMANMILFVGAIVAAVVILIVSARQISPDLPGGQSAFSLRNWKGDKPTAHLLLDWLHQGPGEELVAAVVLANMPQFVISSLYLAYNGIFTCMLQCHEYSQFGVQIKKPLRVTTPKGKQRSTYFLSLPYRYSVPLMAASLLLSWLVSQSLFLARIDSYAMTVDGEIYYTHSSSQIGYSCLPFLLAILLAVAFLVALPVMGRRELAPDVPIVASCSAAIAAACHRPESDFDAAYLTVRWGAVAVDSQSEVGHCCFTSKHILPELTDGRFYA